MFVLVVVIVIVFVVVSLLLLLLFVVVIVVIVVFDITVAFIVIVALIVIVAFIIIVAFIVIVVVVIAMYSQLCFIIDCRRPQSQPDLSNEFSMTVPSDYYTSMREVRAKSQLSKRFRGKQKILEKDHRI